MPVHHRSRIRTVRRRSTALAVGLFATAALVLTGGPASATETRAANSQSPPQLVELASEEQSRAAFDVFRFFSDCLYIAAQPPEHQMYPSTPDDYENRVNACLGL